MRVLLSTIGSRGDVQPLVALAVALRALGQDVHVCVPPDFRDWIERLGLPVTPIGPELRWTGKASPSAALPTPEQRRQMTEGTVATQFETLTVAARGCDIIVGATALQIAAPSVAEWMGIPYVFAAFCPCVLPSPHHAPPVYAIREDTPDDSPAEYPALWARNAERFDSSFGAALNAHRARLGRSPRRRGHDDRGGASRRPTGHHSAALRPALLGAARRSPRRRHRACARNTGDGLAGASAGAHVATRCGGVRRFHGRCGAQRRRAGRGRAGDSRRTTAGLTCLTLTSSCERGLLVVVSSPVGRLPLPRAGWRRWRVPR